MKKLFVVIICFCYWGIGHSQNSGTITYEQKANLHRRLTAENEEMKKMIPEFRSSNFELLYTETTSLYRPVEEDEPPMQGGGGMRFRIPETIYFKNTETETSLVQRSFFEKKYLIEDTLRIPAWKLGTESKNILGLNCMKATLTTEDKRDTVVIKNELTAWFTPDIFAPFGPESYGGLPGVILELNINNSEVVYTAKSINPKLDMEELKAPTKGEKISNAAFQSMMNERMKEMMKNNGGRRMMMRF